MCTELQQFHLATSHKANLNPSGQMLLKIYTVPDLTHVKC